ncbi:MAG TPA: DUF898 family protein [Paludibacter sp.]|nr:DUF898 family protein [Paludibacter sp.]
MKNYFDFNLTGKKLLPYWLIMYVIIAGVVWLIHSFQPGVFNPASPDLTPGVGKLIGGVAILYMAMFVFYFYFYKLGIQGLQYKDQPFTFKGKLGRFLGILFPGIFLSIITFGIYIPWLVKRMMSFFVDNSEVSSNPFSFKGKGGELFIIFLVTLFIPIILIAAIRGMFTFANGMHEPKSLDLPMQAVTQLLMIPYIYFFYKWKVNISYKGYLVKWETDAWKSCGTIFVQMLLIIITLGIYYPLGYLRIYKYFAERTVATSEHGIKRFGYDLEPVDDFLYIWGQILLSIITIGIYVPWALCNIMKRVLGKSHAFDID